MKLVISDALKGLKTASATVLAARWQRCKLNFLRNGLVHAGKGQQKMAFAAIIAVFALESFETASAQRHLVGVQLRGKLR